MVYVVTSPWGVTGASHDNVTFRARIPEMRGGVTEAGALSLVVTAPVELLVHPTEVHAST